MTRNNYLAVLALFLGFMTNAQSLDSMYYYYREQKIDLSVDKNFLNIITTDNFDETSLRNLGFKDFMLYDVDEFTQPQKIARLEFEVSPSDSIFKQTMDSLRRNPEIRNIGMFFKRGDSIPPIGTSNIFYVKLKNIEDFNLLQTTANQKGATIERQIAYMPEWYIISVNNPLLGTALKLSNEFYETKLFEETDPSFMFNFGVKNPVTSSNQPTPPSPGCYTNDPKFNQQWGLHGEYGINICEAWEITEGAGVRIAVIDSGVDKDHPDINLALADTYDCQTGALHTATVYGPHGTRVAGIATAIKNNATDIAGVAPQATLVSVSHLGSVYPPEENTDPVQPGIPGIGDTADPVIYNFSHNMASGIMWAISLNSGNAKVINCSWGDYAQEYNSYVQSGALDNAIQTAINKDVVVIFATGNASASLEIPVMDYPANSHPDILAVGASDSDGKKWGYSGWGDKLDIVAPGVNIKSTMIANDALFDNGTSFAVPHVAGVAALIRSVNPCLTAPQVRDIIEKTARKVRTDEYDYIDSGTNSDRPNGSWNPYTGYGLLDAAAAVQLARSRGIDLYIRDTATDTGEEPNTTSTNTYSSVDIWVRHLPDSGTGHQNPEYHPTNPNYVYVRVKNRGCVTSSGNDILNLYWSKAGTSMSWEDDWNGGQFPTGELRGDKIGYVIIPPVQGGQEIILEIPWNNIPNPEDYKDLNLTQGDWHFCLLARIESEDDPMTFAETSVTGHNVRNNNNIAQTNVSVITVDSNSGTKTGATIAVGNPFNQIKSFHLNFIADTAETGRKIFEEAEVSIILDEGLVDAWSAGGKIAYNITQTDENTFMITGDNASLNNLVFAENQIGTVFLQFNFLTQEVTEKELYLYHIVQEETLTNEIMGGEVYEIHREPRSLFFAYTGGNVQADKNETIVLSAESINEPAVYNWYDSEGNLIYEGADFEVSVEIAQTYKLEIIALTDGYKDYSEVEVSLNPNSIEALYPNPASTLATVTYKINEGESAYLAVTGFYGSNLSNNYILDINQNTINLDISSFPQGLYAIALVVNGQIQDSINLIKQ